MASNFVYVFQKKASKYSWVAEIRSMVDSSNRPPQQVSVAITAKGKNRSRGGIMTGGKSFGQTIYATVPYINQDIPIAILFRALNCLSDKEILEKICFDPSDTSMMEAMRSSLEEGKPILTQDQALSYIGSRGSAAGASRQERIRYA